MNNEAHRVIGEISLFREAYDKTYAGLCTQYRAVRNTQSAVDTHLQCSKIGFWLGVMMMKTKSRMKKKQVKAYTIFAKKRNATYAG